MANAFSSISVPVPASYVWDLIGGFDALPDWLHFIPASHLTEGGRVRHLKTADGESIVERLMAFDEKDRSYSYHILESPFPQKDYLATLRVRETEDGIGSRVEWFGEFTPVGVSEAEVAALFQGIYDDGLQALAAHFDDR